MNLLGKLCPAQRHMINTHPNKIKALRTGKQLNPGVSYNPLVPFFAPNIYFQAAPQLADRYLKPLSLPGYFDQLDDAQKVWAARHMDPTIYMDPNNWLQVKFADKIVGQLLTSQLKPQGESVAKYHCSARTVSYP